MLGAAALAGAARLAGAAGIPTAGSWSDRTAGATIIPADASPADEFRRIGAEIGMPVVGPPLAESDPL